MPPPPTPPALFRSTSTPFVATNNFSRFQGPSSIENSRSRTWKVLLSPFRSPPLLPHTLFGVFGVERATRAKMFAEGWGEEPGIGRRRGGEPTRGVANCLWWCFCTGLAQREPQKERAKEWESRRSGDCVLEGER